MLQILDKAQAIARGHEQQAAPDTTDIDALAAGIAGTKGVLTGGNATVNGTNIITIAGGTAIVPGQGTQAFVGGSVTIADNTSGYERTDLICLNSSMALHYIVGTPGNPPVPPAVPTGEVPLHRVDVGFGTPVVVNATEVLDKRVFVLDISQESLKPKSAIYFVDPTYGNDANDGKSWGSAFATVAHALSTAGSNPADIHLSPGSTHTAAVDTLATNAQGTRIIGAGRIASKIVITGTGTYGIKMGHSYCTLSNVQVDSASAVTHMVGLTLGSGQTSNESTTLENIYVTGGTNGVSIGPDTSGDVSEAVLVNCVTGGQSNAGFLIGNGTSGNVLEHRLVGCYSFNAPYGIYINGSGLMCYGMSFSGNSTANVHVQAVNTQPIVIQGGRSENSNRLWDTAGSGGICQPMTIRDFYFSGESMNADGFWIQHNIAGSLTLSGVTCNNNGSTATPSVRLLNGGIGGVHTLINVSQKAPVGSACVCDTNVFAVLIGYMQQSSDGAVGTTTGFWTNGQLTLSGNATDSNVSLSAVTGHLAQVVYEDNGTAKWVDRFAQGSAALNLFDAANGRNHIIYTPGASNTTAVSEFGSVVKADGGLDIPTIGQGLKVAEGTNAKQGTATLVAGTVTVANTSVTANSRIFLTTQSPGGTIGMQYVSARVAGTSFTITSTSPTDTSTVAYEIFEPG